jgi:hypothetical protein
MRVSVKGLSMPGTLSAETIGFHMHPEDSIRSRVRFLRSCSKEELQRALELAISCSLVFPGYGHRRTVVTLRKALERVK